MKTPEKHTIYLSVNQAATESGRAKSTISKALKSGKLSYVSRTENGQYEIDPAELFRVFPKKVEKQAVPGSSDRMETLRETAENTVENRYLKRELDMLREQMSDLREQRDKWQSEATANRRLLENHSTSKSFMARVFGKKDTAA